MFSFSSTFRLPDVIIAGEQKCGTKSLLTFLLAHPGIIGDRKEYHFTDTGHFARDFQAFLGQMHTAVDNFEVGKLLVSKTGLSAVNKIREGYERLVKTDGISINRLNNVYPNIPYWAKNERFK